MGSEPGTLTRILVVDDSKLMLKSAHKTLGNEFEVITAVDGDDAWKKLEHDPSLQVLFTDLDMPRCDGFELLQRVRQAADPGLQSMPVIIVTGLNDDETVRMRALDLGATDFITKPFTSTDLLARARAHAKYQRITKQLQAQSMLDPLTGLASKPEFLERLQQDIAYARRHGQALALVRLEIEDLRGIFLKRGKAVAEQLVVDVSKLIRARIRKEDTAARIGLGGFAIALPGGELEGIEGFVARLQSDAVATLPVLLSASVLSGDVESWPSAQEAVDRCQALAGRALAQAATTVASELARRPTQALPQAAPQAHATATAVNESLHLDPLLELLDTGHKQQVIEKMPEVLRRLGPLLRLLDTKQRLTLIRFLEGPR